MGRSALALLASFAAVVMLSLGTDAVMHATGVFPPFGQPVADGPLVLASIYRTVFAILGGYIVARLAPNRPMRHALISGGVGLVLSIAGAVATWDAGPAFGPKWYPLSLVATALPASWAGGKIFEKRNG